MAYRPSSGRGGYQNNRMQTINQQEKLLAEKKKEILQKLEEKKKKQLAEEELKRVPLIPSIPLPAVPAPPPPKEATPSPKPQAPGLNTFSNDGSFLEKFRKMQEALSKGEHSIISIANAPPPPPPTEPYDSPSPAAPATSTQMKPSSAPNAFSSTSKMKPAAPLKFSKPTVFQDSDSDDENDSSDSILPPEDPEMKEIIETFAKSVANGGVVIEEIAAKNHKNNPRYRFLLDTSSKLHQYYRKKVNEYRIENQQIFADKTVAWLATKDASPSNAIPSSGHAPGDDAKGKRKRKSRWGNEMNTDIPPPKLAVPPNINPVGMIGTTELSEDQKKQLIEQKQMQAMYNAVISRQKQLMQQQEHHQELKKKYEYDSDEDVEGGTWEHKLRAREMRETQEYAEELTTLGRGKHHLGDFLPPEELEKFMETLNALKEGRTPDYSDYKEFKLQADNIGFQMLQRLGWKEGDGLGSDGQGITAPVNRAVQRSDNQGLGIDRPANLTKEDADNEYDAYRKRMMLAYRFRPNPLNNPRRPYY
ncbi:SURP and G-patch domain-containing protein 1-like [Anneissia japonica]|uniref:SURP and G-patch domain-containing protein 1-like n=1 Tax=Anneissia japonica TaxID=1529436 RepID=UPI00142579E5|nr:SURP and G-patch domain-containing protein 1-like [Anneissia japonica]